MKNLFKSFLVFISTFLLISIVGIVINVSILFFFNEMYTISNWSIQNILLCIALLLIMIFFLFFYVILAKKYAITSTIKTTILLNQDFVEQQIVGRFVELFNTPLINNKIQFQSIIEKTSSFYKNENKKIRRFIMKTIFELIHIEKFLQQASKKQYSSSEEFQKNMRSYIVAEINEILKPNYLWLYGLIIINVVVAITLKFIL